VKKMNCCYLTRNNNMYMCLKFLMLIQIFVIEICFSFLVFLDHMFLIITNIELLYNSPVNFSKGNMGSFFSLCTFVSSVWRSHFAMSEFTFVNRSDDGELWGQGCEI
jgi:hypothetical protein